MHARRIEQFGKESTVPKSKFLAFASSDAEKDHLTSVAGRFKTGWKISLANNVTDYKNALTTPGLLSITELRMSSILTPGEIGTNSSAQLAVIIDKAPRPESFVYQSALDVETSPELLRCATSPLQVKYMFLLELKAIFEHYRGPYL